MTLAEWADKYGIGVNHHPSGGVFIFPPDRNSEAMWELHHLKDYAVSSRSGPLAWMVPSTYYKVGEFKGNPVVPHGTFAKLRREAVRRGATDPDAYAASVERKMMHRNPELHHAMHRTFRGAQFDYVSLSHGDIYALLDLVGEVVAVIHAQFNYATGRTRRTAYVSKDALADVNIGKDNVKAARAWLKESGLKSAKEKSGAELEAMVRDGDIGTYEPHDNPPLGILSNPRMKRGRFRSHRGRL